MYKQQGDVLFFRVDEIPQGASNRNAEHIVVAEGKATGHAHVIINTEECQAFDLANQLFIKCGAEIVVSHNEHKPVTLDPGVWRVAIVREYDHFAEEAREVID